MLRYSVVLPHAGDFRQLEQHWFITFFEQYLSLSPVFQGRGARNSKLIFGQFFPHFRQFGTTLCFCIFYQHCFFYPPFSIIFLWRERGAAKISNNYLAISSNFLGGYFFKKLFYPNAVYRISISYYSWNTTKSLCGCCGWYGGWYLNLF